MEYHEIGCERCGKREGLRWNGEHWLPIEGWCGIMQLDSVNGRLTGKTLCGKCAKEATDPLPQKAVEKSVAVVIANNTCLGIYAKVSDANKHVDSIAPEINASVFTASIRK